MGYTSPLPVLPREQAAGTRVLGGLPGRVGHQTTSKVLVELLIHPEGKLEIKTLTLQRKSQQESHRVQQANVEILTVCQR